MNGISYFIIYIFLGTLLVSCGQQDNKSETKEKNSPTTNVIQRDRPKIYEIDGEKIFIRVGPGKNFDKLINKKASEMENYVIYCEIDYTVKVIIEEAQGDWSKIRVVDPDWLSNTYIGWIPTKNIIKGESENDKPLEKLNKNEFEIIKTDHNSTVQNFYVLIKQNGFDKESAYQFIKKFRNEHCSRNCNIYVYDSKLILPLVDKYPIEGREYINLADHFVAMSTFDAPNYRSWYPMQDIKYSELGGKNWKKEPIK